MTTKDLLTPSHNRESGLYRAEVIRGTCGRRYSLGWDTNQGRGFLLGMGQRAIGGNRGGRASSGPASGTASLTDVLYLQEPGDTAAISVNDLHQDGLGDCFLIAGIGELAINDPAAIQNMIRANPNGTDTVTLYDAAGGGQVNFDTSQFQPVQVRIKDTFNPNSVNSSPGQDVVGDEKEIWPQVLEKAYAKLNGGYKEINQGGYPGLAMEQLTGQVATAYSPRQLSLSELQRFASADDMIVMDTPGRSNLPFSLVGDHAYMFEGIVSQDGTAMVRLGNPWGTDQPPLIPFSSLSQGIDEIDIGKV